MTVDETKLVALSTTVGKAIKQRTERFEALSPNIIEED